MKVYAIKLKNMGNDEYGFTKYIWASKEQKEILEMMRNDVDKRYNFVEIGGVSFSPMDIAYIEEKEKIEYDLPKYVVERIKSDEKKKLGVRTNKNICSLLSENA